MEKNRGKGKARAVSMRRRVILAQQSSGLSVASFCRREDIPPTTFYRWLRRVEIGSRNGPGRDDRVASTCHDRTPFAEMRVRPVETARALESAPPSPSRVEIILSSGDRLCLSESCNPFWLERVVRLLRSGTC